MLWGFRQKSVYPVLNPFFGGISTEEGLGKGYYDCLKGYIGLFLSPSSVEYPPKKEIKKAYTENYTAPIQ